MRNLIGSLVCWPSRANASPVLLFACAILAGGAAVLHPDPSRGAEFGTGPWVKGYTDIFGGILPPVPGFYFRTDAHHYEGDANRTIFNGFVQLGIEEDYTATIAALPRSRSDGRMQVVVARKRPHASCSSTVARAQ